MSIVPLLRRSVEDSVIFLPIEVDARETESKFLLATEIASRGHEVLVGYKGEVESIALEGGVPGAILLKAAPSIDDISFVARLRDQGIGVLAQDEEAGIAFAEFVTFRDSRRSLDNIGVLDRFLCWGQDDFSFLYEEGINRKKLVHTGSPRVSLWGESGAVYYHKECRRIANLYGDFVLIATNFTFSTRFYRSRGYLKWARSNLPSRSVEYLRAVESAEGRIHRHLADSVVRIARNLQSKGVPIVIKCHPSEDANFYRSKLQVDKHLSFATGPIGPWIQACAWFIHHGSTTGLEALASGKPVGHLDASGLDSTISDLYTSNLYGLVLTPERDVLESFLSLDPQLLGGTEVLARKTTGAGTVRPVRDVATQLLEVAEDSVRCGTPRLAPLLHLRSVARRLGWDIGAKSKIVRAKRPGIGFRRAVRMVGRSATVLGVERPSVATVGLDCFLVDLHR